MSSSVIGGLGLLFLALAAFLVYCGAIDVWTGVALAGFAASVFALLKCSGGEGKSKGRKVLMGVFFALSLCFVALFVLKSGLLSGKGRKPKGPDLKLEVFEKARAGVFARKLVEVAPGTKALLLIGEGEDVDAIAKLQEEELRAAFPGAIDILATERFPVERLRGIVPRYGLGKKTSAKDFEAAIMRHRDCDLIISFVGLPREHWKLGIWRWNAFARPKIALLEGEPRAVMRYVKDGRICLFASYKEGWTYTPEAPEDQEKAFSKRYVLVGPEGIYKIPKPEEPKARGDAKGK
jgi:hypothetical protein